MGFINQIVMEELNILEDKIRNSGQRVFTRQEIFRLIENIRPLELNLKENITFIDPPKPYTINLDK